MARPLFAVGFLALRHSPIAAPLPLSLILPAASRASSKYPIIALLASASSCDSFAISRAYTDTSFDALSSEKAYSTPFCTMV